jgi:methylphosphotriester-DNA--protein-cysteine methyltransferase
VEVVMDDEQRYEAATSKDARFDGVFFTAVLTTGIYCRPSCPAITPKRIMSGYHTEETERPFLLDGGGGAGGGVPRLQEVPS